MNIDDLVAAFLLTGTALIFLLAVRIQIVHDIRMRAIDVVFAQTNWMLLKSRLYAPDYGAMCFDLTCWTFAQFYPDLQKLVEARRSTSAGT